MSPPTVSETSGEVLARRVLSELTVPRKASARERLAVAADPKAKTRNPKSAEDALLGYPVESAQLAEVLEDFSRLCMAGWTASEALRHAGSEARPGLKMVIEAAAARAAGGMAISEALASCSAELPPLVVPALRAWERNGQRDSDLRILTREMRRLGAIQQRNVFFQIRSFMERAARRERKAMSAPTTRVAQNRIDASRGGIANRSRATMRWSDLFVALWRCGVPISEALEAAGDACGNGYYRRALYRAAEQTRQGLPLSVCLAETRLLPAGLIDRLRTGEASGRVDETLEEFARIMEGDAQELGGQYLFMRRILPVILIVSAITIFVYTTRLGASSLVALIGALIFLPVAFAVWEFVFKQTVAGEPKLGIGKREPKRSAERGQR